jgi:hypothetical protein
MNRHLVIVLLLIPVPLVQLVIPEVKADVAGTQYDRVARNIGQVERGQTRESVRELLGPPVNKSVFGSSYWPYPASFGGWPAVDSDWWFDGREVWVVGYKEKDNRLVVCSCRKAKQMKW